jgi:hypothetical protein
LDTIPAAFCFSLNKIGNRNYIKGLPESGHTDKHVSLKKEHGNKEGSFKYILYRVRN